MSACVRLCFFFFFLSFFSLFFQYHTYNKYYLYIGYTSTTCTPAAVYWRFVVVFVFWESESGGDGDDDEVFTLCAWCGLREGARPYFVAVLVYYSPAEHSSVVQSFSLFLSLYIRRHCIIQSIYVISWLWRITEYTRVLLLLLALLVQRVLQQYHCLMKMYYTYYIYYIIVVFASFCL